MSSPEYALWKTLNSLRHLLHGLCKVMEHKGKTGDIYESRANKQGYYVKKNT